MRGRLWCGTVISRWCSRWKLTRFGAISSRSHQLRDRRARVAQRIEAVGHHAVLGDRAQARHQAVGRQPGDHPEQVERPDSRPAVSDAEQHAVGDRHRSELVPADVRLLALVHAERALIAARAPSRRRAGTPPSPASNRSAREIAPHLAAQAVARDRERSREAEIGILRRSGASCGARDGRRDRARRRSTPDTRTASCRPSRSARRLRNRVRCAASCMTTAMPSWRARDHEQRERRW